MQQVGGGDDIAARLAHEAARGVDQVGQLRAGVLGGLEGDGAQVYVRRHGPPRKVHLPVACSSRFGAVTQVSQLLLNTPAVCIELMAWPP
jgi:hypothetical protein